MSDSPTHNLIAPARPGSRLALFLTYCINPLILPPVTVWLLLDGAGSDLATLLTAVAATLVFFAAIPFVVMLAVAARNADVTIELRSRKHRNLPFIVAIISNVAAVIFFGQWQSAFQSTLLTLIIVYLVNNVLLMIINFRFKISLHMASIAGTSSIILFILSGVRPIPIVEIFWLSVSFGICVLLIPVIWWARARLGAHTRTELMAGTAFGLCMPFAELYLLSPLIA